MDDNPYQSADVPPLLPEKNECKRRFRRALRDRMPLLIFLFPFVVIVVVLVVLVIMVFTQI